MALTRQYDHEYKMQAIKLAKELGGYVKAAAELGIPKNTLYNWMKAVREGSLSIGKNEQSIFSQLIATKNRIFKMFELEDDIRLAVAEYKEIGDKNGAGGGMNNPTEATALREICEVKKVTLQNSEVILYPERWLKVIESTYSRLNSDEKEIFRAKMRGVYYLKICRKKHVSANELYRLTENCYKYSLAVASQLGLIKVL